MRVKVIMVLKKHNDEELICPPSITLNIVSND